MSQPPSPPNGLESVGIAITGRGVVSSIAEGADAFVDALYERRSFGFGGQNACLVFRKAA